MISNLLQCCNKAPPEDFKVMVVGGGDPYGDTYDDLCCRRAEEQDVKVVMICADAVDPPPESFSSRFQPDLFGHASGSAGPQQVSRYHASARSRTPTLTPRQQSLMERLRLPSTARQPVCASNVAEDELLQIFQAFVLDLHGGVYMTQVNANDEHSDIHCQLQDDLLTLKVDQRSGCIIEFPLTAVTRIYRIVRDGKSLPSDGLVSSTMAEHIVVVEFMRRKLVLVFEQQTDAQSFLMCTELLVRFAQEEKNPSPAPRTSPSRGTYKQWPQAEQLDTCEAKTHRSEASPRQNRNSGPTKDQLQSSQAGQVPNRSSTT